MVLLVTIDHFEPNPMLVNANKLKPYHPYVSNTKILVSKINWGGEEWTINSHECSKKIYILKGEK